MFRNPDYSLREEEIEDTSRKVYSVEAHAAARYGAVEGGNFESHIERT